MSYTVLARRYRSQSFDDVVGQGPIAQTLKNAVKTGHVAHGYLFTGTRGVGKTTMARILAKALNCLKSDEPTPEPCCKCDSCVSINTGDDIDVIEIDGASNRGIDNIRELRQRAIYRPARARHKIYIIDEVHMLTNEAFNALLKILEEPPEHIKFIFATTEPHKVPATIQSRCQRFDFNNISSSDIAGQLTKILKAEKIKYDEDVVVHVSRLANGSMRDGLSLLDQLISTGVKRLTVNLLEEFLGLPNRERICELLDLIGDKNAGGVLKSLDSLLSTGQTCTQIGDALIDCMRDLLVMKSTDKPGQLVVLTEQERQKMTELLPKFDVAAFIYNITTLERLRWTMKNSDNPRALLEASMLRLALSEHFMDLDRLLEQSKTAGTWTRRQAGDSVKKKQIEPPAKTKTRAPAREAEPTKQSDAEPKEQVEPAEQVGIDLIRSNWQSILESVKGKNTATGGFLDSAEPVNWEDNELTLIFPQSAGFAKQMSEKRKGQIEQLLSDAIGLEIKVRIETVALQADEAQASGEAQSDRKNQDQALSDPAVRTVLSGLNATVTGIDKVKE